MFLSKLQVPDANGDATGQTLLMPKLQFRFRLTFNNFGTNNETAQLTRQVIDCSRPNVSFAKITVPVYNSTIYLAGKHTWNTMTINIRDDAQGSVSQLIGQQLQKQLNFAEQASAASASDYKFQLILEMLDGGNGAETPQALEQWDLEGCYLEGVNYNTVNYGTSEVVTISLTVQYDNAVQYLGIGVNEPNGVGEQTTYSRNPDGLASGDGTSGE